MSRRLNGFFVTTGPHSLSPSPTPRTALRAVSGITTVTTGTTHEHAHRGNRHEVRSGAAGPRRYAPCRPGFHRYASRLAPGHGRRHREVRGGPRSPGHRIRVSRR